MSRRMSIVVEGYVAGGADRVLIQLLPYFSNWDIELMVNDGLDTSVLLGRPLPGNVTIKQYGWMTPADLANWVGRAATPAGAFIRRLISLALRYPATLLLFMRFLKYLGEYKPQVVFINNGGYPGGDACRMAAVAAVVNGNIHVVHAIHNMARRSSKLFLLIEWFIDRLVERGGCFVAVSEAVAESLRQIRNLRVNAVVIGNGLGVTLPPVPPPCRTPLELLQVGYLGRVKNQRLSILALGVLAQKGIRNIRITFAGKEVEDGYLQELRELAERLGVLSQIHFAGFVRDVDGLYPVCDALLLTSTVEGMPMCILEAMRAGRAVIASAVGGVPELVEQEQTGFLLHGQTPEELAEVLERILLQPDILRRMGEAASMRFMEKFTLDAQASKYLELIELPTRQRAMD